MKTRENILKTLIDLFLASQDSVADVPEGSVVRSILYAAASGLEEAYKTLDESINKLYVDKATGEYLDSLIEGLVGLKRLEPKRSLGYVLLEFGEPITDANINQLVFSFAQYSTENDSLEHNIPGTVIIPISPQPGRTINVTIVAPQSINAEAKDYEIDSTTGVQNLFAQFREFILSIYNTTGKPVRYAILPVVTVEVGKDTVLEPGEVNYTANFGITTEIKNIYLKQNASLDQYSIADPDGINAASASPVPDSIYLGTSARISGGTDRESDDEYRSRYYLYLSSLTKGTEKAIELGLRTAFPSTDIRAVTTSQLGAIDVILYSQKPVTPNIVTRMYEVLKDYRPAGIKINIFTAKSIPIAVLFDGESEELKIAAEKSKKLLQDLIDNKQLGESLVYTEIHELLDIPQLEQITNVFYGLYLNKNLFDLFSSTLNTVYSALIDGLPSPAEYQDVYNAIINEPENVKLFDASRAYNGYPLVEFVRKAKEVPDPTQLPSPLDTKVAIIQTCPAGTSDIDCLEELASSYPTLTVTLHDIKTLLGEEAAVYYRLKLLTLPNILHVPASKAEPLIQKVLTTDALLLNNKEKRPVSLNGMEKLLIGYDELVNNGAYKFANTVGVRKYEPVD